MTFLPYAKVKLGRDSSGRPLVIDRLTHAMLTEAERLLGCDLTIVQGSYREGSGAAASAGTHDKGGVVDIRTWDLPRHISPQEAVRVLRRVGFAAWYRTAPFDPHIHAVVIGHRNLHWTAAEQVEDYKAGLNGLANNGPDDGPKVSVRTWAQYKARQRKAPRLKRGSKRTYWVKKLQRKLGIVVDGDYGPATARAVKKHRRAHKIWPANGRVGRRVWRSLGVR